MNPISKPSCSEHHTLCNKMMHNRPAIWLSACYYKLCSLSPYSAPHLLGDPAISQSYQFWLGGVVKGKEAEFNNQKPELWIASLTLHWLQAVVIPHHQHKPPGFSLQSYLQWCSQDIPKQHIQRMNSVSVYHIPSEDSAFYGETGKQSIIHLFIHYDI